jgi:hypothetical protein
VDLGYPVKPLLPPIFTQRRHNKGFESLAVSADGAKAWTALESPIGSGDEFKKSRVVRVLELNVTNPFDIQYSGLYIFFEADAKTFPGKPSQKDVKIAAASFVYNNTILFTERTSESGMQLSLINFSTATNLKGKFDGEDGNIVDKSDTDLEALGVQAARKEVVFSSLTLSFEQQQTYVSKQEGLLVLSPTLVATMFGGFVKIIKSI